jgi:hypothetical protein
MRVEKSVVLKACWMDKWSVDSMIAKLEKMLVVLSVGM